MLEIITKQSKICFIVIIIIFIIIIMLSIDLNNILFSKSSLYKIVFVKLLFELCTLLILFTLCIINILFYIKHKYIFIFSDAINKQHSYQINLLIKFHKNELIDLKLCKHYFLTHMLTLLYYNVNNRIFIIPIFIDNLPINYYKQIRSYLLWR